MRKEKISPMNTSLDTSGARVHPLADELNQIIERENPHVLEMLSDFGKRIYFPKGILSQSAEAKEKATRFDATIGIAKENGKPMFLPSIMQHFPSLTPDEALTYAPATGRTDLRSKWRELLLAKNPSLASKCFSTPIVTSGVTHALSLIGDLFVDKGDVVLLPDKFWENYELLYVARYQAQLKTYPFFSAIRGFCVEGLREALAKHAGCGRIIVILNFPNNPTGYSVTNNEANAITKVLVEAANRGSDLVVVSDDAYFGLFYDDEVLQESMFAQLAGIHERILAVKVDGPTKEQYVWGFRTGMLTFATRALQNEQALYNAFEKKAAGAIRSVISNCSHPVQTVLAKEICSDAIAAEHKEKHDILELRAKRVMEILSSHEFDDVWEAYPFNAGYFMCLKLKHVSAEAYRTHLLENHSIGVIADCQRDIRVAFSAVEIDDLPELFQTMARAARELQDAV